MCDEVGQMIKRVNRDRIQGHTDVSSLFMTAKNERAAMLMKAVLEKRRYLFALLLAGLLYVGSYCSLSACGEYCFSQSGRVRYSFGLSISDISIWHPRFLQWQRFTTVRGEKTTRGNFLGYAYSPLIAIDRSFVHPTEQLIARDR
mgnify:CR=1 FL=1